MTPDQAAKWLAEFMTKNNARLTETQRQNFQMCQQMLLAQKSQIDELLRRQV